VYQYDTDDPRETRIHTYAATVNTGPEHAALTGAALYAEVLSECRRKGRAQEIAEAKDVDLTLEVYEWVFDANRVLEITFLTNVPPPLRQQIQDECDLQFGPGKALIL
jgi:hypothetical protein